MRIGCTLNIPERKGQADAETLRQALRTADLLEGLGYETLFVLEHHFSGYLLSPSPLQLLAYFAARTDQLILGTAVAVLPWHDPIRIAEEIAMLDILSGGRCIFGFGRGKSRAEFRGFRIPQAESRQRFREASEIIRLGLTQETFEYHGRHFDIPRISIRPRPFSRPTERFFGAASTDESAQCLAELGFGLMISTHKCWRELAQDALRFADHVQHAGNLRKAPALLASVSIAESCAVARECAMKHLGQELHALDAHYAFSTDALSSIPTYEHYRSTEQHFKSIGDTATRERATLEYASFQIVGDPEHCIRQIQELQRLIAFEHLILEFVYGDIPHQQAIANMTLFAETVLPYFRQHREERNGEIRDKGE